MKRLPGGQAGRPRSSADDPRVAAAALMFHVVNADGVLQESEKTKLRSVLSEAYSVTGVELDALLRPARRPTANRSISTPSRVS